MEAVEKEIPAARCNIHQYRMFHQHQDSML
jgi:hypothetical protein